MFEGNRLLAKLVAAAAIGLSVVWPAEAKPAKAPDLKAEAQAFADRKCLAEAMYFEAGFEGEAGMVAVAEVVLRRAKTPGFPKSICKVVYEDTFDAICQFSFACDGARVRPRSRTAWKAAWALSMRLLKDKAATLAADTTQGALFFHADYVSPDWETTLGLERTVQIGRHIFYKPADGDEASAGR